MPLDLSMFNKNQSKQNKKNGLDVSMFNKQNSVYKVPKKFQQSNNNDTPSKNPMDLINPTFEMPKGTGMLNIPKQKLDMSEFSQYGSQVKETPTRKLNDPVTGFVNWMKKRNKANKLPAYGSEEWNNFSGSEAEREYLQNWAEKQSDNAFGTGFANAFDLGPLNLPETEKRLFNVSPTEMAQEKKPIQFALGEGSGELLKQLSLYKLAGPLGKKVPGINKISNPFLRGLVADQLIDNVVQTPQAILRGISEDKTAGDIGKDILKQNVEDAAINLAFGVAGEGLKTFKESRNTIKNIDDAKRLVPTLNIKPQNIAYSLKLPLQNTKAKIDESLLKPKSITVNNQPIKTTQEIIDAVDNATVKAIDNTFNANAIDEAAATATKQGGIEIPKIEGEGPQNVGKFRRTLENSPSTGSELRKQIQDNPDLYNSVSNEQAQQVAKQVIEENGLEAARELVTTGDTFSSFVEGAIGKDVYESLQKAGRFDDADAVRKALEVKFRNAGRSVQIASIWSKSSPKGMIDWAEKMFKQANDQLPANKKIQFNDEFKKVINDEMSAIAKLPDGKSKDLQTMLLMKDIVDKMPRSVARKLSTVQAISHLLNAKTTLRNILGNFSFSVAETISNVFGIPADVLQSLKTGQRTVTLPTFTKPLKEGLERAKIATRDVKLGIDSTMDLGKYQLFKGQTFRENMPGITGAAENILAKLEKALGYTLKVPDEFFKGYREELAISQMMKMANVDTPTAKMIEQAAYEARYATFQDESLPARVLQGLKDVMNKMGGGKTIRGGSGATTKEFGLGDFLVKYTRVPGNIISRGMEYTPGGYIKALKIMHDGAKQGIPQREISLAVGRATTGTGLIAIGAWLKAKGLIVGEDKDRDVDARVLDRAQGLGNYQINLSALERMLLGQDYTPQAGDELSSYNWNQPVSIALSIGSAISDEVKKDGNPLAIGEAVTARSIEEIVDLPTMFIVKSMFYEQMRTDSNILDVISIPLTQGIPGFVPSVVRQSAQAIDPISRDTRGDNPLESSLLKLQSNIPGLRQNLLPRLDPLGQPVTYGNNNPIDSLINPANTSVYQPIEFADTLKKLEEYTGLTTHYPQSKPMTSFSVNGNRYELTPQQQNEFQQIAGRKVKEEFDKLLKNIDIDRMSDRQRKLLVDRLTKTIRLARDFAKKQIIRGMR